ncbi:VCBS repeat-containing protein [Streptomyces sp. R302]|uniref:FG-GAP repeat domain-containing protein n=1 Tax=unclassified Streptomyces TaxID=2593676 RepID=UPI00145C6014|nr:MULTISPECIES: VCBS repeat-containing protein [unclassified Streptomyces]NML50214.1 VCBS repeat-containing protein [Streptomyces sp. R301]NML79205.1 VCBS repeat-containing protein [Streptomyces sp. R302]
MLFARTRRRHLAASVAAVLAVTLGAGALTAPSAVAADGPSAAAAAEGSIATMYPHTEPFAGGSTGFFSYFSHNPDAMFWTSYATGRTESLGTPHGVGGDLYISSTTGGKVRNMATGATLEVPSSAYKIGIAGGYVFTTDREEDTLTMYGPDGEPRPVSGFPSGGTEIAVRPGTDKEAVLGFIGADKKQYHALVDLASATITETFATPGAETFRDMPTLPTDISVNARWVTWSERNDTTKVGTAVVRDRTTGELRRIELGTYAWGPRLLGDWLVHVGRYTTGSTTRSTLLATHLTTGATTGPLLDRISGAPVPDGTDALLAGGGNLGSGFGAARITLGEDGRPAATLIGSYTTVETAEMSPATVPTGTVDLDTVRAPEFTFNLNHTSTKYTLVLKHTRTGMTYTRSEGAFDVYDRWWQDYSAGFPYGSPWYATLDAPHADGSAGRIAAYNGDYTWEMTAESLAGLGPALKRSGSFRVTRSAKPHDFDDNGSPDLLARDASGVLRSDSGYGSLGAPEVRIGGGWQVYDRIEATGDLAGSSHADLVARDRNGVLYLYRGNGRGGFEARTQVGGGWQVYDTLSGGSDYTGDGRADLIAADRTGVLWLYRSTGNATRPFATRVRIGSGWGVYDQLVGTGNIAGAAPGDLLARDKDGVLWMYLGKGDGTFTGRTRIGGGFGRYSELIGAGDYDGDKKNDLLAVEPATRTTYVFTGTGKRYTPLKLTRAATTLFKGAESDLNG